MTTFTYTVNCPPGVAGQVTNTTCTLEPAGDIHDNDVIEFVFVDSSGASTLPFACTMLVIKAPGNPNEVMEPFVGYKGQTCINMLTLTTPLTIRPTISGAWSFSLLFVVDAQAYFLDPIIIIKPA
jgi:hypothetical protein